MKDTKYEEYIRFSITFLILFSIMMGIYVSFFNTSTIYPETVFVNGLAEITYKKSYDYDIASVLLVAVLVSIMLTFLLMIRYNTKALEKCEVIIENALIISKEISIHRVGVVANGGGGSIRKSYVVKFMFADGIERDLVVDEDHYISAIDGDKVTLSYKKYSDSYIFVNFVL